MLNCGLSADFEKYQKTLVNEIFEKFGLEMTKKEKLHSHFTLKYLFETKNIEEVEKTLETFVSNHKKTPVGVGGFDSFYPKVIFVKVMPSNEARANFVELIKELRKIPWLAWNQCDGEDMRFHSTIAEECNEKFDGVWEFIQSKEPKHFDCFFDNITILKQASNTKLLGKWKVHNIFKMK